MGRIFKDNGEGLLKLLEKVTNAFEVDKEFPSLKRSIRKFNFDDVYSDALDFIDVLLNYKEEIDRYLTNNTNKYDNFLDRFKAEDSLRYKWNKESNSTRRLFEVCNDLWGIRGTCNLTEKEIGYEIDLLRLEAEKLNLNIDIVNFYNNPKSDGYKGIHVYFRNNPKCYPIELQFWNRKDWFLQRYTHEIIYKQIQDKEAELYSLSLRKWFDALPECPSMIDSFIDYYYEVINGIN